LSYRGLSWGSAIRTRIAALQGRAGCRYPIPHWSRQSVPTRPLRVTKPEPQLCVAAWCPGRDSNPDIRRPQRRDSCRWSTWTGSAGRLDDGCRWLDEPVKLRAAAGAPIPTARHECRATAVRGSYRGWNRTSVAWIQSPGWIPATTR